MIDWKRVIPDKLVVGKSKINRVIYRDETKQCRTCQNYILKDKGGGECLIFPKKKWQSFYKACVQYK